VQALAPHEGDINTVILRALEEYITVTGKRNGQRSGKYQKLVKALSTPVSDLHLSARPASTLKMLKHPYVYELVQKSPLDLSGCRTSGRKSLREVKSEASDSWVDVRHDAGGRYLPRGGRGDGGGEHPHRKR